MTTERIKGSVAFSCDNCSETIQPECQDDFGSAWQEAFENGWRCFQAGDEWQHHCPACCEEAES
jgi:hypothetical protein